MVAFFEGGQVKILADTPAGTRWLGRQPYQSFSALRSLRIMLILIR
jgi:hypothetical protein